MRAVRRPRTLTTLRNDISLLNWLRVVWLAAVFWFEYGIFRYSVALCGWGDNQLSQSSARPSHVLLVTDPQVRSVSHNKPGIASRFQYWLYHESLRKNWRYARQMKPDTIVFLGDILCSGRKIKRDKEYSEAVEKFRDIFSLPQDANAHFVPGNQDVGLNLNVDSARQARNHYVRHFGPGNRKVIVSNHTFVFLDAPLLVEEDYHRAKVLKKYDEWRADDDGSVEFIRSFESDHTGEPVILFSHIPLARPDTASCGPLRERGAIHKGAGPGYQNTLGKLTTQFIFETIKPSIIFSGDDRDYCDYTHEAPRQDGTSYSPPVREVTVKSFSPHKHIRNPGFHLLSLVPSGSIVDYQPDSAVRTFTDSPCFLPSQTAIYTSVYLPLCAITFLVLLVMTHRKSRARYMPLLPSPLYTKHKNASPPVSVTYISQYEMDYPRSNWLSSGGDATRLSSHLPQQKLGKLSFPWSLAFLSRGRSRHTKKHSDGLSDVQFSLCRRLLRLFTHRTIQVLLGTFLNFVIVILPSLVLWTLIARWTLG